MQWTKLFRVGACLAALTLLLTGCHPHQQKHRLTVAVIPMATTDEHWKAVHAGALEYASQHNIEIVWQGPLKYDDRSSQSDIVENATIRPVDGIVLAPIDDSALRGVVEDAWRNNIPVVIVDSDLRSDRQISFIATDNEHGGYLAGEHLAKLLGGKGKVTMLRGMEGNTATANREKGFRAALKNYPGITLVNANIRVGSTLETAYQSAENLLQSLQSPGGSLDVDGIFCPNESATFAMLRALHDSNSLRKVRFVGFDRSKRLNAALRAGDIDGLVVQNPYRMGYEGVKAIVDHLNGLPVPKRIDTGAVVATPQNANDPQISSLLEPDLRRVSNE
jgi:ribose transport system substrate-binding protein